MGIIAEQKLVIKHTFLEYVCEDETIECKSLRQRARTEPTIDLDILFGEVSEVSNSGDASASDTVSGDASASDIISEADHSEASCTDAPPAFVTATPEASPWRLPSSCHMPLPEDKSWEECLPPPAFCADPLSSLEYTSWSQQWSKQYATEGWWVPLSYDFNRIEPRPCSLVDQYQFCVRASATEQLPSIAGVPSRASIIESKIEDDANETRTTVMLRGLPEMFTRATVLQLLDAEGFFGRYNFVYLPIDFKRHRNLGYALVNLVTTPEALRFSRHFDGFSRWNVPCSSICSVSWCSPQQGLPAHIERYRNSPVMHESVPEEWRPLLLMCGTPIAFPPPTMKIKAPRLKGIELK